jgi:hypothetical protein
MTRSRQLTSFVNSSSPAKRLLLRYKKIKMLLMTMNARRSTAKKTLLKKERKSQHLLRSLPRLLKKLPKLAKPLLSKRLRSKPASPRS